MQNKCNFQNPPEVQEPSTIFFQHNFFARAGWKTHNEVKQRQQINGLGVQPMHEKTNPRITKNISLWSPQPIVGDTLLM